MTEKEDDQELNFDIGFGAIYEPDPEDDEEIDPDAEPEAIYEPNAKNCVILNDAWIDNFRNMLSEKENNDRKRNKSTRDDNKHCR